jgi:hypothetical protein
MYVRNDWDGDGVLRYAGPACAPTGTAASGPNGTFQDLCLTVDGNGDPIQLIDQAFADAQGLGGKPKHGYLCRDMQTIAGRPIDWTKDFALCAIPSTYGRTGYHTFIVSTDGVVWRMDRGRGAGFLSDFPADPEARGWTIVE